MQGPKGSLCRASLGDARMASPKSGQQVRVCWVWARRVQTHQAQSQGRHVVTIPSLRVPLRTIPRAPKLGKKIYLKKGAKLGKKGANLVASREHLEQIPTVMVIFGQAIIVLVTFVQIRNISAVIDPALMKLYR